ncbi:hypothetical protein EBB07_06495 [Paenibacillaceae bacterium]|nr:hypothetical protein EBB07_06495 [Paenibacillaceae bacterium]
MMDRLGLRVKLNWLLVAALMVALVLPAAGTVNAAAGDEISRLIVNKNELALEAGSTYALTATAVKVNGGTEDVTIKTDWTSGSTAVATVYAGSITAKAEGTAVITATYSGKTVIVNVTVSKKVKALTMNVNEFDLRIGQEKQVELTAIFEDGTSESVTKKADWSVGSYATATVVNGLVSGKKSGQTEVTARYGNQSISATVSVEIAKRLDVENSQLFLLKGEKEPIKLMATYPDGSVDNVTDKADWESDNDKVADAIKGVVTAYGTGTTTITAKYGTKTTSFVVNVDASKKIEVDKQDVFMKTGTSKELALKVTYIDGKVEDVTSDAKWESSDESIAFVTKGKISAYSPGEATITASFAGKSVEVHVDVDVPRRLELDNDVIAIGVNDLKKLKLTATFADGSTEDITEKANWTSSDNAIVFVKQGSVTGYKSGIAQVTASYGGRQIKATVKVNVPNRITVDKDTVALQVGDTTDLKVSAVYEDGRVEEITQEAEWSSANNDIAEARKGTITGIATGSTSITVKYGTRTVNVPVSVGVIEKLTLSQKKILLEKGKDQKATLSVKYKDGLTKDVTDQATWQSSVSDVADVSKGLITANKGGTAVITASFGGESVSLYVEVDIASSLSTSSAMALLEIGENQQITLTSTDSEGNKRNVTTEAVWSVNSAKVAEVSDGLITALANGKATVTAKFGGKTITVAVEVGSIQRLTANTANLDMKSGESYQVKLTALLADGRTKDVTDLAEWKAGNSRIISVNNGKIEAINAGKSKVTAKYNGKTISVAVEVDVLKYLDVYSDNKVATEIVLKRGQTLQLSGVATYSDNKDRDVTVDGLWSSSKATVAHVKHGLLTAQGKGKANLTFKFGNKTAKVRIIVE